MQKKDIQEELHKFIDPMTPNGKYLYHYTGLNTAFEHILHSGTLQLGSVKSTNDPRESKDWYWGFRNTPPNDFPGIPYIEDLVGKNSHINKIKEGCKLCCFSLDNETRNLFSGRGWGHPRMWAQYADKHKGVCLVFDKDQLIKTAEMELIKKGRLYCGEVIYLDDGNLLDKNSFILDYERINKESIDGFIDKLIEKNYKQYFFTKHIDWQQEREFRIFLKGKDDKPEYISIGESIKAIIVGVDFPIEAYRPLIDFYSQKYHIPYGYMGWYNGMPNLQYYISSDLREKYDI